MLNDRGRRRPTKSAQCSMWGQFRLTLEFKVGARLRQFPLRANSARAGERRQCESHLLEETQMRLSKLTAGAAAFPLSFGVMAADTSMSGQQAQGNVNYLSGGVGEDEAAAIQSQARNY